MASEALRTIKIAVGSTISSERFLKHLHPPLEILEFSLLPEDRRSIEIASKNFVTISPVFFLLVNPEPPRCIGIAEGSLIVLGESIAVKS